MTPDSLYPKVLYGLYRSISDNPRTVCYAIILFCCLTFVTIGWHIGVDIGLLWRQKDLLVGPGAVWLMLSCIIPWMGYMTRCLLSEFITNPPERTSRIWNVTTLFLQAIAVGTVATGFTVRYEHYIAWIPAAFMLTFFLLTLFEIHVEEQRQTEV